MRIIGDDAPSEVNRRRGDDAVCDGYIAMAAANHPCGQGDLRSQLTDVQSARDQRLALLRRLFRSRMAAHLVEKLR